MASRESDKLYEEMFRDYYWRHRIYLGDSKYTPGRKSTPTWDDLGLPDKMDNRSFLDIGASDGLYSFEAERRGAEDVLATDVWENGVDSKEWTTFASKETFDLAHKYLNSDIRSKYIDAVDIDTESVGEFDIVLCAGVLPVIRDIYSVLERLVSVANEQVIIKTAVTNRLTAQPGMELWEDESNRHWIPNRECIERILRECKITDVSITPLVKTNSDPRIPETNIGQINREVAMRTVPTGGKQIIKIPAGSEVKILCEKARAYRIDYNAGVSEPNRQGWVDTTAVSQIDSQIVQKATRAYEILRQDGPWTLFTKIIREVQPEKRPRISVVITGHI